MTSEQFWAVTFLGNSLRDWAFAAVAFLVTFTALPLVKSWVTSQRKKWTDGELPAGVELVALLVARTTRIFLWILALYAGARFLEHPPRFERALDVIIVLTAWFQFGLWAVAAVRFALDRRLARQGTADAAISGSLDVILFIARILIFAIAFLLALDNLGVNITALVAGLGIGGIAVALAVQTVLGDLLASLSIALDKPFKVGDMLKIDDYEGSVEHIGIKSLRLRSVTGEQIILANADVLKARVRNMGRMPQRRVLFTLGVAYETSKAKLDMVPWLVSDVVRAQDGARFEHCLLRGFGESSLDFEVLYFFDNREPRRHPLALDAVIRGIHAAFEQHGIEFAYPTRAVIVRGDRSAAPVQEEPR